MEVEYGTVNPFTAALIRAESSGQRASSAADPGRQQRRNARIMVAVKGFIGPCLTFIVHLGISLTLMRPKFNFRLSLGPQLFEFREKKSLTEKHGHFEVGDNVSVV